MSFTGLLLMLGSNDRQEAVQFTVVKVVRAPFVAPGGTRTGWYWPVKLHAA
jgi:hypothetical protein